MKNKIDILELCTTLDKDDPIIIGLKFMEDFKSTFIGGEIYMVGGAVRDIVMGNKPKDIDFCTNVPIDEIDSIYDTHDIGQSKDFGILTVQFGGQSFEVANYRVDQFSGDSDGRNPDSVVITESVREDVLRRDLTINGLLMQSDGIIIDYVGGLADIDKII
jgi:tRNA nucleotidyltransferase (CCA-adding enzyme)